MEITSKIATLTILVAQLADAVDLEVSSDAELQTEHSFLDAETL